MSHRIYHTEGIVIGTFPAGEASMDCRIVTKDLGIVRARAQGLRAGVSKLRFGLQFLSESKIDLVRGREMWRIVGALPICSYGTCLHDPSAARALGRVLDFTERLVGGDEHNGILYDAYLSFFSCIPECADRDELRALEARTVARILMALGYWDDPEHPLVASHVLVPSLVPDLVMHVSSLNMVMKKIFI